MTRKKFSDLQASILDSLLAAKKPLLALETEALLMELDDEKTKDPCKGHGLFSPKANEAIKLKAEEELVDSPCPP